MDLQPAKEQRDVAERKYVVVLKHEIDILLSRLHPATLIRMRRADGSVFSIKNTQGMLDGMDSNMLEEVLSSVQKELRGVVYMVIYHSLSGEFIEPKPEVLYSWREAKGYVQDEIRGMSKPDSNPQYRVKDILLNLWFNVYYTETKEVTGEYYIHSVIVDKNKL